MWDRRKPIYKYEQWMFGKIKTSRNRISYWNLNWVNELKSIFQKACNSIYKTQYICKLEI